MESKTTNDFKTISLVMGIISIIVSILFGWFLFFSLTLGALACIFAILSKHDSYHLEGSAITGFWCGIIAIILSFLMFGGAIAYLIITEGDFLTELQYEFQKIFWESYYSY